MHEANRIMLGLPSRLIAKIFVFRLIYGGSAYAYSVDPDFSICKYNIKQWQNIIDKFYDKYRGLRGWHSMKLSAQLLNEAFLKCLLDENIIMKSSENYKGESVWPRTTILNYPVQGLGADIMAIARVDFATRFRNANIQGVIINTVHDSIEVDVSNMEEVKRTSKIFFETFQNIPKNFKEIFGVEYNLPMFCEVSYSPNRKDLKEILLTEC